MKMKERYWLETKWQVPIDEVDEFTDRMLALGSIGTLENPPLHPDPLRKESTVTVYFEDGDLATLKECLAEYESGGIRCLSIERIPEGDWATAWKAHFKPFHLTKNLVICPSWETYEPKENERVLILDPGMAFGTGKHDSTRFSAEFLAEVAKETCAPLSLLDVGCGSGILSFIGMASGFESVVGIDNDPEAIRVALENLALNPALKNITFEVCTDDLSFSHSQAFDVVVANIIAEALCELKPHLLSRLKPGGYLILSGIIPERKALIESSFGELSLISCKTSDEWCATLFRR